MESTFDRAATTSKARQGKHRKGRRPMTWFRQTTTPTPGSTTLIAVAIGYVALWLILLPANEPTGRVIGEICGAEAVLLLSCSLVLTTLLPPIERAFAGLDRVAIWHRRAATAAVLLLVPHLLLVTSPPDPYATTIGHGLGDVALVGLLAVTAWALAPRLRAARWPGPIRRLARASYERWLSAHRLAGLFVAVAVVHGALVDPILHRSSGLRVAYLVVGVVGVAAYAYRELLARFVVPIYDYRVADVQRPNDTTIEVSLEPEHDRLRFQPGQFAFFAFGGEGGWQRHPFSISSAPSRRRLEISVKAVGDFTCNLQERLKPGTPAKVVGPFGGFDYRRGGRDQIWIAGGIGITPFMSWIRSLDECFFPTVDFYYSVAQEADALHLDEIRAAAAVHPTLNAHVVASERDGLLTAAKALNGRPAGADVWVYMCGPPPMMTALSKGFRDVGIPASRLRWEQFGIR